MSKQLWCEWAKKKTQKSAEYVGTFPGKGIVKTRIDPLSRESRHCGTRNGKICSDNVSTVTAAGWVQFLASSPSCGGGKPRFLWWVQLAKAKQQLQHVHSFKSS